MLDQMVLIKIIVAKINDFKGKWKTENTIRRNNTGTDRMQRVLQYEEQ